MSSRRFLFTLLTLVTLRASVSAAGELSCEPSHLFAGRAAVCAIRADGQASCWGDYYESFDTYYLIHRHGDGEFLSISVGWNRSCGIRADHTVACWYGYNEQSLIEEAPAPEGEFSRLSLSIDYNDEDSCGLRPDGSLVCWNNDDPTITSTPLEGTFVDFSGACGLREDGTVVCIDGWIAPEGTFASLATASYPACGLRENGEISCWLETGEDTSSWLNGPPDGSYKQVSVHSIPPWQTLEVRGGCAITTDDDLVCWGGLDNPFVPDGKYLEVVAGGRTPCAIRADGAITCWPSTGPTYISPSGPVVGDFAHISAGGDAARRQSTCALRTNGLVTCWGNTEYGQTYPPAEPFLSVSAAAYQTCGVREDGQIKCWGEHESLQPAPPSGTFSQVSVSNFYACGLRTDGAIVCWGMDSDSLPVPDGEFTQISAGYLAACGLRQNGQVECWSYADGPTGEHTIDSPVGSFESVTVGGYGIGRENYRYLGCGIRPNKTIECWGDAEYGLLDPPAGEFTSVVPGGEKACAVRTNGDVVCWGRYYDVDQVSLYDVKPGPFVKVALGYYHTCGIRPDGTVECWGLDQLQSLCSAPATCGNGEREPGEYCDGGGFAPGQNCNARCFPTPCGQPVSAEAFEPRVSDALFVLQTSVELRSCTSYVCDVNGDLKVDAADALVVMQKAVQIPVTLHCPRVSPAGHLVTPWEPCPYSPFFCRNL